MKIECGVPQGSILGPLIFNINSIDMFYGCENSDIENYADDKTPYPCASDINTVIPELQITATKPFTWFSNSEKVHLLLSSKTLKKAW